MWGVWAYHFLKGIPHSPLPVFFPGYFPLHPVPFFFSSSFFVAFLLQVMEPPPGKHSDFISFSFPTFHTMWMPLTTSLSWNPLPLLLWGFSSLSFLPLSLFKPTISSLFQAAGAAITEGHRPSGLNNINNRTVLEAERCFLCDLVWPLSACGGRGRKRRRETSSSYKLTGPVRLRLYPYGLT